MEIKTQKHRKFNTNGPDGKSNGYLIPIYNFNEYFFDPGHEPQQVYLTVVAPGCLKGPHLHHIRTGFFTCIKGNVKIIVKIDDQYNEYYSGEDYDYLSVEIPTGIPAVIQNISKVEAFVLNMPNPAWTADMKDEHTADFSDYKF